MGLQKKRISLKLWHPVGDGFFKWRKFGDNGPPICFTNPLIRRMLKLANARKSDIIYELGSGWGQNLLTASTEFHVRKCVGFESIHQRYETALRRIGNRRLSKRVLLFKRDYQDLFTGKIAGADISEATIVLYSLATDSILAADFSNHLRRGCRLVYYNLTLFPEFMPDAVDYPFYMSKFPFTPPTTEIDWLRSVLRDGQSGRSKTAEQLWSELYHDYNVEHQEKRDILD